MAEVRGRKHRVDDEIVDSFEQLSWQHNETSSSSSSSSSTRRVRSSILVIDWLCFSSVVRRSSFSVFLRTLLHLARDHGFARVVKIILLTEQQHVDELPKDVHTYFIDTGVIEVKERQSDTTSTATAAATSSASSAALAFASTGISFLAPHSLSSLYDRTLDDELSGGDGLILLASSRPHMYASLMHAWMTNGHSLLLIHGHGKTAHSLPLSYQDPHRRPPLDELLAQCQNPFRPQISSSVASGTHPVVSSPNLTSLCYATAATSYRFVRSIHRFAQLMRDSSESSASSSSTRLHSNSLATSSNVDLALLPSRLLGCYGIWDQPVWYEHFERPLAADAVLPPNAPCPQWNAQIDCAQLQCIQPHVCQACLGEHRLHQCRVNQFVQNDLFKDSPSSSTLTTDTSPPASFLQWFYANWYALLHCQVSQFVDERWRMSVKQQMLLYHHISTAASFIEPTPGTTVIPPCDAIVFLDWQNVHVPLRYIAALITAIQNFVLVDRPGVTRIRIFHVLLDRLKQKDVACEMERIAKTSAEATTAASAAAASAGTLTNINMNIVHIDASNKAQMIDQKLTSMLRTEPRAMQFSSSHSNQYSSAAAAAASSPSPPRSPSPEPTMTQQSDLVCLVSGDIDFSSDLTRLVSRGHRVLVVHNSQAQYRFRSNSLWEDTRDFVNLPELSAYKNQLEMKRMEKKSANTTVDQPGASVASAASAGHKREKSHSANGSKRNHRKSIDEFVMIQHPVQLDANSNVATAVPPPSTRTEAAPLTQRKPCTFYNRGQCNKGAACPYRHVCQHCSMKEELAVNLEHPFIECKQRPPSPNPLVAALDQQAADVKQQQNESTTNSAAPFPLTLSSHDFLLRHPCIIADRSTSGDMYFCKICHIPIGTLQSASTHIIAADHRQRVEKLQKLITPEQQVSNSGSSSEAAMNSTSSMQQSHPTTNNTEPSYTSSSSTSHSATSSTPSSSPSRIRVALKSKEPIVPYASERLLLPTYHAQLNASALALFTPFAESDQLHIIRKVERWNKQTPFGKDGKPFDLSTRVAHLCYLKQSHIANDSTTTAASSSSSSLSTSSIAPAIASSSFSSSSSSHSHSTPTASSSPPAASSTIPIPTRQSNGMPRLRELTPITQLSVPASTNGLSRSPNTHTSPTPVSTVQSFSPTKQRVTLPPSAIISHSPTKHQQHQLYQSQQSQLQPQSAQQQQQPLRLVLNQPQSVPLLSSSVTMSLKGQIRTTQFACGHMAQTAEVVDASQPASLSMYSHSVCDSCQAAHRARKITTN